MLHITSEIEPLDAVIVHTPGPEIEQVTPMSARAALFDDTLHLPRARREHAQLVAALRPFATVYQLRELLAELLADDEAREELLEALVTRYGCAYRLDELRELPPAALVEQLIVGLPARRGLLDALREGDEFDLPPLPNLYFTRDAAMIVGGRPIIGAMASATRTGEALLYRSLFQHHPLLDNVGPLLDGTKPRPPSLTLEGGDVLVLSEETLLIGLGERTSSAGIERLASALMGSSCQRIIVQSIPRVRASIHLDMLFTMLDHDLCAVHAPAILGRALPPPLLIDLEGPTPQPYSGSDLLTLLAELGFRLTPVVTGGSDPRYQAREQWQKGTNFFAMAPGKVVSYARNEHTYHELEAHGFRVVSGQEVVDDESLLTAPGRVAVAIEGAELSRGGGGARCMTLPIRRQPLPAAPEAPPA